MSVDYFFTFRDYSHENYPSLDDVFWQKMADFYTLVRRWGEKINLTSNLDSRVFFNENIADPLCAYQAALKARFLVKEEQGLLDLGCGGGFVGFVWHLASSENMKTQLVDSDRRKINFCKQVIRELGLKNISALQARAEKLAASGADPYDIIVSRATWNFSEFTQIAKRLCAERTQMIYFSSGASVPLSPVEAVCYEVPGNAAKRQLWCFGA